MSEETGDTHVVLAVRGGVAKFVPLERPKRKPEDCGMSNEELECLGCGRKLGCIRPGHCYAVEGQSAFKFS